MKSNTFKKLDESIKQVDIAAIGAMLTNVPFPFSNLGIVHPAFVQGKGDLRTVASTMRQNIAQVDTYLHRYCEETGAVWCESELKSFEKELHLFDQA